jgi:hypothetical protein
MDDPLREAASLAGKTIADAGKAAAAKVIQKARR